MRKARNCGDDSTISRRLFTLLGWILLTVFYLRFVDQHHGYIVANRINAAAFRALQASAVGL
jgi:hypothetical protein